MLRDFVTTDLLTDNDLLLLELLSQLIRDYVKYKMSHLPLFKASSSFNIIPFITGPGRGVLLSGY